jgi:hypothetical protein
MLMKNGHPVKGFQPEKIDKSRPLHHMGCIVILGNADCCRTFNSLCWDT